MWGSVTRLFTVIFFPKVNQLGLLVNSIKTVLQLDLFSRKYLILSFKAFDSVLY